MAQTTYLLVLVLAVASSTGLYTHHGDKGNSERPTRIEALRAAVLRQFLERQVDWKDDHQAERDVLEKKIVRRTLDQKNALEDVLVGNDLEKVESSSKDVEEVESSSSDVEGVDPASKDVEGVESAASRIVEKVESTSKDVERVESLSKDVEKVESSPKDVEEVESAASRDVEKVDSSTQTESWAKNVSSEEKRKISTLPRPGPDEVPVGTRPLRSQPTILNIKHEFRYPVVRMNDSGGLVLEEEPGVLLDPRPLGLRTPPAAHGRSHQSCGGTFNDLSGIISSPDYPFNYPNNVHCVYTITLPAEYTVGLDCNDFAVQPGDAKCENDFLAVSENDEELENMERYCGDKALALFSSTSNMTLVFQTDGAYRYRGFMCRYRALNPDGTGADGTVIVNTTAENHPSICSGPGDDGWQGKCGVSNSPGKRIVGGHITGEHQFPWMVAVLKECGREMDQYCNICGGTVVNPNWILTGAHCIVSVPVEDMAILLGDHNLYTLTPSQKFFRVDSVYIHPDFNVPKPLNNDVALVKLPQEMAFGRYVAPVCLPPRSYVDLLNMLPKLLPEDSKGGAARQVEETSEAITIIHENLNTRNVSVYGWGTINDHGEPAQRLRQVSVTVLPNTECEYYYGEVVTERMMCTSGAAGRGPCRGDSGSPAQMQMVDGRWVQVGVLAFGAAYGCEVGFPSGNVLLPLYVDWIEFVTDFDFSQYY